MRPALIRHEIESVSVCDIALISEQVDQLRQRDTVVLVDEIAEFELLECVSVHVVDARRPSFRHFFFAPPHYYI